MTGAGGKTGSVVVAEQSLHAGKSYRPTGPALLPDYAAQTRT